MKKIRNPLTIREILETSQARSRRWHAGGEQWLVVDWSNAIAGEVGEMCNKVKKLRRIQTDAKNINTEPGRQFRDPRMAALAIAQEAADVLLYMPMLIEELGFAPEQFEAILRDVFNRKSEEYGFPERL